MAKSKKKSSNQRDGWLETIAKFVVTRWKAALAVWIAIILAGAYVYTTAIPREGFPPISFPVSFVSGQYVGHDAEAVDRDILIPISNALGDEDGVTGVMTFANDNFFQIQVEFTQDYDSISGTELVRDTIAEEVSIPTSAQLNYIPIDPASFLYEYDMLLQVYTTGDETATEVDEAATAVAEGVLELDVVGRADVKSNVTLAADGPAGPQDIQSNFSRIGIPNDDGSITFYSSTTIGVDSTGDIDIIELSETVNEYLETVDLQTLGVPSTVYVAVGADFAPTIESQISFLQDNMVTGLIAVSIISLLLITWRASIITALFMLTVMVATIITLYVIGYTLNTITLFALILSLGLFVDDATIVVEAIDVGKRNRKLKKLQVVGDAVRRVGRASLSGTLTTILVFAILATPTGILGEFIRLIPITVIVALILSFILSITLIPLLSRFIILRHRDPSWLTRNNPVLKIEDWLSNFIESRILEVRTAKGKVLGALALLLSIGLIMAGGYIFGFKVDSNTFPPSKDTDQIGVEIRYTPGTDMETAQAVADEVDAIMSDAIGDQIVLANYGTQQQADNRSAVIYIDLVPFTERDETAPQIVEELQAAFDAELPKDIPATVLAAQLDLGPPAAQYPFGLRVVSEDTEVLRTATNDISTTFMGQQFEAMNGTEVNVIDYRIEAVDGQIWRTDGERYAVVRFAYDNSNPTLVTLLSEEYYEEVYTDEKLAELGLTSEQVTFDAGEEGEFQDSFNTLLLAIPISLFLMYVLLVIQFRSIMQPFLILLAIPFTLFGVAGGLYITDNAASFFALTGFIGLIGIAVNNTIMLTDYANQERRDGKGAVDAIAAASRKRLRPLIATSLTTVMALLPLALSDPFWEGLAFTIIFGLLSSTFLVIISFPYYYLLLEVIRRGFMKLFRRAG